MHTAAEGPESRPSRAFRDVLDCPPPRFAKPLPFHKARASQKISTGVIFTDTHRPFHDEAALAVVHGIIKDVRPNLIVHGGDANDCYTISRYSTDPARLQTLQDDLDSTRQMFYGISEIAPDAEKVFLGGNHEDRLRKLIWDLKGAARELGKLRVFQKAMTWPVLLDLESIGWDYVDYMHQPLVGKIPRLLLKHGEVVRKWSAWTAKAEWEKNARSGVSGHTHRMGTFYHRDLNGSHVWQEAGCTCSLTPEYVRQPDWQHGCLVVSYTSDWFHIEPVYIENGNAHWRGKEFAA